MMQELLIILASRNLTDLQSAVQQFENRGGRVMNSFPPSVIMGSISDDQLDVLSRLPAVKSIFTSMIPGGQLDMAPDDIRQAMAVWNDYLTRKRGPLSPRTAEGLSWDEAGLLPPDLPPEIKEEHRWRDQESDSEKEGDD